MFNIKIKIFYTKNDVGPKDDIAKIKTRRMPSNICMYNLRKLKQISEKLKKKVLKILVI